MVAQHDQHNCVCLLFGLRRTADRRFASCRGAPFDGVGAADWLARLDFSFGLVLRLVFAETAWSPGRVASQGFGIDHPTMVTSPGEWTHQTQRLRCCRALRREDPKATPAPKKPRRSIDQSIPPRKFATIFKSRALLLLSDAHGKQGGADFGRVAAGECLYGSRRSAERL